MLSILKKFQWQELSFNYTQKLVVLWKNVFFICLIVVMRLSSAFRLMTLIVAAVALLWSAHKVHGAADFNQLFASFNQRWGGSSQAKFTGWQNMLQSVRAGSDTERLKKINDFFNRQIRFGEDVSVWNQPDYWATPLETMGLGAGDCEDFAIAKYFSLREIGVSSEKLRLIYVRAKTGTSDAAQAHMVLAYYAQPDAEPLVLDNLIGDIRPASRRPDLVPVFSFNSEGVFSGVSGKDATPSAGTGRLSRWEDLLKRAKAEGFE